MEFYDIPWTSRHTTKKTKVTRLQIEMLKRTLYWLNFISTCFLSLIFCHYFSHWKTVQDSFYWYCKSPSMFQVSLYYWTVYMTTMKRGEIDIDGVRLTHKVQSTVFTQFAEYGRFCRDLEGRSSIFSSASEEMFMILVWVQQIFTSKCTFRQKMT